jgi:hypothetical protein
VIRNGAHLMGRGATPDNTKSSPPLKKKPAAEREPQQSRQGLSCRAECVGQDGVVDGTRSGEDVSEGGNSGR